MPDQITSGLPNDVNDRVAGEMRAKNQSRSRGDPRRRQRLAVEVEPLVDHEQLEVLGAATSASRRAAG